MSDLYDSTAAIAKDLGWEPPDPMFNFGVTGWYTHSGMVIYCCHFVMVHSLIFIGDVTFY